MLTTLRRDRRTRRHANFNLESLDDRLVLSAGAGGAAAEAAGAKAAAIEHRHEVQIARHDAKLARMVARHAAKEQMLLARANGSAAPMSAMNAVTVGSGTGSASASSPATSASGSAASTYAAPAAPPASSGSVNPSSLVPSYPITTPSSGTGTTTTGSGSSSGSTSGSPGPLPANVAAALQSLYQEYENAGGGDSFTPSQPSDKLLQISGTSVMVNLKIASTSDFNTSLSQLQSDGMSVSTSSAAYGLVDGMVPIANLPTIAQDAASVTPVNPPVLQ